MTEHRNHLDQPIGFPLPGWTARPRPPRTPIEGRFCRVEPVDPDRHAASLHEANSQDAEGRIWTYMAYGPFDSVAEYRDWMTKTCLGDDPLFHAIVDSHAGKAVGVASYLRIDPPAGVIVGEPEAALGHAAAYPAPVERVDPSEGVVRVRGRGP